MSEKELPQLNTIIHSRVRLAIMSILISSREVDFTFLKKSTDTTDGNLSTHLSKLEEVGFIYIKKTFRGKKPLTTVSLTEKGREAFREYVLALEQILPKNP